MTWPQTFTFDLRHRAFIFAAAAVSIYLVALQLISGLHAYPPGEARAVALGVTADLVILVPLLFWLLVIRAGAPRFTLVPVTLASLTAAGAILPAGYRGGVEALEALAIPLELGLVGFIVWKVRRSVLAEPEGGDAFERLRRISDRLLGGRAGEVLAFETGVFFFAFAAWRLRPPTGAGVLTHHRRELFGALFLGLSFATVVEIIPVHILVHRWSPTAAWILTGLSAYGLIWLMGDYRAVVLRPSQLSDGVLRLRVGLRWNAEIPLGQIERVRPLRGETLPEGALGVTLMGPPRYLLELREPIEVRGVYGLRRRVSALGVTVDDEATFEAGLPPSTLRPDDP